MKQHYSLQRTGIIYPVAVTMLFGTIVGGSVFLFVWQLLEAFIFIVWGTGGRAIAAVVAVVFMNSIPHLISYVVYTLPILAAGALVHSVAYAVWARSSMALCAAIAALCSIPVFWKLLKFIPAGQVAGVPGNFAILVWVLLEVLKWLLVWGLVWYFTNALAKLRQI